jgi:uncharacterized membrane protein
MGIFEVLEEFIYKYYIDPIVYDLGYNPVNTLTWALILGFCIFGILRIFTKLNVRADWKFTKLIIPYIIAGSTMRVMEDAELFSPPLKYIFITPPIYVLMFIITVLLLTISIRLHRSGYVDDWKKIFGAVGVLWALINLGVLLKIERITHPGVLIAIFLLGTGIALLIYLIAKNTGNTMFTLPVNISILWVQLLDASSTFIGMDYLGYIEKHVVPTLLINLTGTAVIMIPLKLMIFFPLIYILDTQFDQDDESRRLKDLMKLIIIILGLAPAARNTLRMVFGI